MKSLIAEAIAIIGDKWFKKRLHKDAEGREAAKRRDHSRQRVRYIAPHPLVQWYVEYEGWHKAYSTDAELPANQSALLLTAFASNLIKVKAAVGLESVLSRLRNPDEFMAAAFEIEVASGYVNRGWAVEFVETEADRSPDLKVTTDEGNVFWVECKYREEISGRDAQISKCWEQLQDKLYRKWGPAKINVALTLRSVSDPVQVEVQALADSIQHATSAMIGHQERSRLEARGTSRDGKYQFSLQYLADPDVEQPFHGFPDLGTDWFSWEGEIKYDGNGNTLIRNPKFFGFRNTNPPDSYIGALNSFNSAVGQLPKSGPGVIWIRVPYPNNVSRAQADLEALASRLRNELSGTHNTRVNAVILSTRFFLSEPNGSQPALTFKHVSTVIEHSNPQHAV